MNMKLPPACAMMHLSRLAEEMVLWSSAEFDFIELDDAYTTGSSIMPQKKNPDVAELARGKVGRVYGNLMAMLTTMKGLPLSYNRDLQEDKEGLFDTVDTLLSTLEVFDGMIETMKVKPDKMAAALDKGLFTGYRYRRLPGQKRRNFPECPCRCGQTGQLGGWKKVSPSVKSVWRSTRNFHLCLRMMSI